MRHKGLSIDDVGVSKDTVSQEIRSGAGCDQTGDFGKYLRGLDRRITQGANTAGVKDVTIQSAKLKVSVEKNELDFSCFFFFVVDPIPSNGPSGEPIPIHSRPLLERCWSRVRTTSIYHC